MTALVISHRDVRRLLPMATCIDLMADALSVLGRGEAENPLRWAMRLPKEQGILGIMPGQMATPSALGLKIVSIFPGNHGTEYDSHQGVVVLFDPERGFPIAIVDAAEVTAIRTAAVSGLATRLLAREDAGDLGILGTGVQARTHLEAIKAVREVRRVRVYSRSRTHRERFAATESKRHGLAVEAVDSARAAVADADIVCTTTSAREPILEGAWLAPGVHINAVGSSIAVARELDSAAVARSSLFIDRRESTLNEAGDFLIPKSEGAIDEAHIRGEIGEILLGQVAGRTSPEEITLFKSLGLAVEDLAAVHHVYLRAKEEGLGTPAEIGAIPSKDQPDATA